MKTKMILAGALASVLLSLVLAVDAGAYNVLLPDDICSPATPYLAEQDHYSGPACVQMALNCCPTVTQRTLHTQNALYTSILTHNSEPPALGWFSDPAGIEDTLEDPALAPCGHWVDMSDTDKAKVLGRVLYWLKTQRYFTPVSIGAGEHWVNVIGYQSNVEPSSSSSTVTLTDIFFYDPLPGGSSSGWVSGTTWLTAAEYWGVSHNRTGSAWHGKYIAIVEPPPVNIQVVADDWVLTGPVLPPDTILHRVRQWLATVPNTETPGPFEALRQDAQPRQPLLVTAEDYSYYLVELEDRRFAAVFNAYDGSFEEIRAFDQPRPTFFDPEPVADRLQAALRDYGVEPLSVQAPLLAHRGEVSPAGRISPRWELSARVRDAEGAKTVTFRLNAAGQVVTGLDQLVVKPPRKVTPRGYEKSFELYSGYYFPDGEVDEDFTFGLRGGVRSGALGLQATLGRVDASVSAVDPDIDFELTVFDLSAIRYLGGGQRGELLVYGGPGWAWLDFGAASVDTFTLHAGLGWITDIGRRTYLRADARLRWFNRRPIPAGDVDVEGTIAIGWRW